MTFKIQFLGQKSIIGGNMIFVTSTSGSDDQKGILLDAGHNFEAEKNYFDKFMPMRKKEMVDGLISGLMPWPTEEVKGLYDPRMVRVKLADIKRAFMALNEGGNKVGGTDDWDDMRNYLLDSERTVSHVCISHAHSDHTGLLKYLHPKIQIVAGDITAKFMKMLDLYSSYGSIFHHTSKVPLFFGDSIPAGGSVEGYRSITALKSGEGELEVGALRIRFYLTDHSIPGAGAFIIEERPEKKVEEVLIYTGDIRNHGPEKLAENVNEFITAVNKYDSKKFLVTEGTRLTTEKSENIRLEGVLEEEKLIKPNDSEESEFWVRDELKKILTKDEIKDLDTVFFSCSENDLWRILSFYYAAKKSERKLVIRPKTFLFLREFASHLSEFYFHKDSDMSTTFSPANDEKLDEDIKVYLPKKGDGLYKGSDYVHSKEIMDLLEYTDSEHSLKKKVMKSQGMSVSSRGLKFNPHHRRAIKASELTGTDNKYLIFLPNYKMRELFDILPARESSAYIFSKSMPFDLSQEISKLQQQNYFTKFGINHIFRVHCSGHARPNVLKKNIIGKIAPDNCFVIHSKIKKTDLGEVPERYEVYEK